MGFGELLARNADMISSEVFSLAAQYEREVDRRLRQNGWIDSMLCKIYLQKPAFERYLLEHLVYSRYRFSFDTV